MSPTRRTASLTAGCILLAFAASVPFTTGCQSSGPSRPWSPGLDQGMAIVDLTHTLTPEFPYIPVPGITFPFRSTPIATIAKNGVAANRWDIHEHLGTQIDAPSHFVVTGISLEHLPVRSLIAPLAIIDITERAARDPDAEVVVEDILAWERSHGRLPRGAAVFMRSGWDLRASDAEAFLNKDSTQTMHFPGFSSSAAAFLANKREVAGIGVDVVSIDPGRDKTYQTHKIWLAAGEKWAVEAAANLALVPVVGATLFLGPAKVQGATGGPVRLIAAWPNPASSPIIHQHVGAPSDALANAYLVETGSGVIGIDGTMTTAEGRRLRARLDAIGKPLLAVLVTHPHPDHYGGIAELIVGDSVPVLATAAVDQIIRRDDAAKAAALDRAAIVWPERRVFASRTFQDGESVVLDDLTFTAHDVGVGESHADAYWTMVAGGQTAVFAGDIVVNAMHAFTADGHTEEWLANLDRLRVSIPGTARIYPGHGAPGGRELIDWTAAYLSEYRQQVRQLSAGARALSELQKGELARRMAVYLPGNRLAPFVVRGADAVAAELAPAPSNRK